MSKAKPEPRMSGPRRPASRAAAMACAVRASASGYSPADVEVAALAAGGEGRDRHGLDDRERVALHEDPVLERPGLRLVGVADEVVRAVWLGGHGSPLATGREGRAAAPDEPRGGDLLDDRVRAELDGLGQRLVAAVGAIVGERAGIDDADPGQESRVPWRLSERGRAGFTFFPDRPWAIVGSRRPGRAGCVSRAARIARAARAARNLPIARRDRPWAIVRSQGFGRAGGLPRISRIARIPRAARIPPAARIAQRRPHRPRRPHRSPKGDSQQMLTPTRRAPRLRPPRGVPARPLHRPAPR